MNTNIVGNTNVRLLKNIAQILERVVKRDCGLQWMDRKMSPRSLMLGIYVCYHNACKRARSMEVAYKQQLAYNQTLQTEIKRLKEFEKMAIYAGYSAIVTTYHWSCGDGCCSDSWCHYKIINQFGVCEKDSQNFSSGNYRSRESCEQEIHETYGKHVSISHDDDYSEDNND